MQKNYPAYKVKSTFCKVNLRLIVGDWTCVILFVGLYVLSDVVIVWLFDLILYVSSTIF